MPARYPDYIDREIAETDPDPARPQPAFSLAEARATLSFLRAKTPALKLATLFLQRNADGTVHILHNGETSVCALSPDGDLKLRRCHGAASTEETYNIYGQPLSLTQRITGDIARLVTQNYQSGVLQHEEKDFRAADGRREYTVWRYTPNGKIDVILHEKFPAATPRDAAERIRVVFEKDLATLTRIRPGIPNGREQKVFVAAPPAPLLPGLHR